MNFTGKRSCRYVLSKFDKSTVNIERVYEVVIMYAIASEVGIIMV